MSSELDARVEVDVDRVVERGLQPGLEPEEPGISDRDLPPGPKRQKRRPRRNRKTTTVRIARSFRLMSKDKIVYNSPVITLQGIESFGNRPSG